VSDIRQRLEQEIQAHNELHNNIQAGEEQLTAMKEERAARRGRVTLLQELLALEESTSSETDGQGEEANAQDSSLRLVDTSDQDDVDPAPDGQPEVEG
jgi:hypothetical protein